MTCHENKLAADNPHARPGFAKLSYQLTQYLRR